MELKNPSRNLSGNEFFRKYKFDFDAIYSVFCFVKHETNETYVFALKMYIFDLKT